MQFDFLSDEFVFNTSPPAPTAVAVATVPVVAAVAEKMDPSTWAEKTIQATLAAMPAVKPAVRAVPAVAAAAAEKAEPSHDVKTPTPALGAAPSPLALAVAVKNGTYDRDPAIKLAAVQDDEPHWSLQVLERLRAESFGRSRDGQRQARLNAFSDVFRKRFEECLDAQMATAR